MFRSSSRSEQATDHVTEDHRSHHDAKGAADENTAATVDLSAQSWANQLVQHLEGIKCELNTTEGLWQEWVDVGLTLSGTHWVKISFFLWYNINLQLQTTSNLSFILILVILSGQVNPKLARLIGDKFQIVPFLLFRKILIVVFLGDTDRAMRKI